MIAENYTDRTHSRLPFAGDVVSRVLVIPLIGLLFAIVRKAWLDMDLAWDSLAYHLPCSALRVGIFSQAQYHLSRGINGVCDGFPAFTDYFQGGAWLLTGRPQAANFMNLIGLLICVTVLAIVFRIPAIYSLIAFLSLPMILIESVSAYNDLFGNSFLTIMLLLIFSAFVTPEEFSMRRLLGVFVAFTIAANVKFGFALAGFAALISLGLVLLLNRDRLSLLSNDWRRYSLAARSGLLAIIILLVIAGIANEIKNAIVFQNPIYPFALHIAGKTYNGYPIGAETLPEYLSHGPQFVRWALSVLEFRAFEGRNPLWTLSQGDVPGASPALRMGGFFAPIVLMNFLWLFLLQSKLKARFGWKPLWFVAVMSVITSVLPSSQESRYYMYWALSLIAVNLYFIVNYVTGDEGEKARILYIGSMACCLAFVLSATGFTYLQVGHWNPKRLVNVYGITQQLSDMHLKPNEGVCVIGKNPRSLLYAPIFNPKIAAASHYHVFEAYIPPDCMGARVVP